MLDRAQREALMLQCQNEVRWRPIHPRTMLALALQDEGLAGGVHVTAYKARHRYQALVIATCECTWVEPADLVVFDIGKGEELTTLRGDVFYWLAERNVDGMDDHFWKQPEHKMPSGLWIPATA